MAFTLNSGEFDLGAGFIGRGTILAGETYAVGNSTTGVQGLLNTSGLEGISYEISSSIKVVRVISFRKSDDIIVTSLAQSSSIDHFYRNDGLPSVSSLPASVRFFLLPLMSYLSLSNPSNVTGHYSIANSTTVSGTGVFIASVATSLESLSEAFSSTSDWRFLARNHATALAHYPSTTENGTVFAASCVNSPTQWGLWIAGEVGDRSGYFNQTQGYFSIVILRNGSTWYISAFTPAAANSTSRNDNVIRSFNIVPAPGQTGADRFSELFIARDLGNGLSEPIGKVPGFIYVDMNQAANSALSVGSLLEITPGVGTSYDLLNNGAIVVAQWGLDISATTSNVGSTFTIDTASTPSLASLSSLNRTRTTLEENQRIQITATPPTGFSTATNYWVKNWNPTAFTFQLAATEGGAAIVPFTSSNTNSTITRYAGLIAMPCYQT